MGLGAGAYLLLAGGDDEPVSVDAVFAAFAEVGIECDPANPSMDTAELESSAQLIAASVETDSGTLSRTQFTEMMNATTAAAKAARELPEDGTYALTECSGSWVMNDGSEAFMVVLGLSARGLEGSLNRLGVTVELM